MYFSTHSNSELEFFLNRRLLNACMHGDLNLVKEISESDSTNIRLNFNEPFHWCCSEGHLDIVKFILEKDPNIDIHSSNEYAFRWSCSNGHLNVAQYLFSIDNSINIHTNNEQAFCFSCKNGHFDVVKFLWSLNRNIYIRTDDDYAFRWSCSNGHIDIVKFLLGLDQYINIHSSDEYAFYWSCRNGHIEIAKLLYAISIEINSPIDFTKINTKLITNKQIRKFLKTIMPKSKFDIFIHNLKKSKTDSDSRADLDSIYSCLICLNNNMKLLQLDCHNTHTYCESCFITWYANKDNHKCIYCAKNINFDNIKIIKI